eukprot:gene26031-34633_t
MAIFATNPLQSFLRYSLTFASVSSFVADHGMHPRSPSCDNVSGAPQFDSILGITSTIMAYLLFFPVVYLLSEVIVPGRIRTRKHKVFDMNMSSVASKGLKTFNYFKSMVVKVQPAAQDDDGSSDDDDDDEEQEEGGGSGEDESNVDGEDSRGDSDNGIVGRNRESFRSPSRTRANLKSFAPPLQRRQYPHLAKKAKTKKQNVKRNVYIKYLEDKAKLFLSFDIWILSGFAAHWVKYLHRINREKAGKSRRITGVVSLADSIKQFQQKSQITADTTDDARIDRIIASFNHYAKDSVENEKRLNAQWEEVKLTHLPSYAQLCRDVRLELHVMFDSYNSHLPNATIALIMLTTEEDEGITVLLAFIVGPRSLLFQALQYGTIFSAFVLSSSLSPLMVFSKRLREKNFPDMLFTIERARKLAITREIRQRHGLSTEYFNDYKWIIYLRALIIVATESRVISFMVQMIVLAIIFMLVLFPSPATIQVIVLLFLALVPYAVIKSLLFVVYFGKSIDMQDDDFRALFCMPVVASSRVSAGELVDVHRHIGDVHDNHHAEPARPVQATAGDVVISNSSSNSNICSILEEKSSGDDDNSSGAHSSPYPAVDSGFYFNNPQRHSTKGNAHISIAFDGYNERDDVIRSCGYYSEEESVSDGSRGNGNEETDMIKITIPEDDIDDEVVGFQGRGGDNLSDSDRSSIFNSINFRDSSGGHRSSD